LGKFIFHELGHYLANLLFWIWAHGFQEFDNASVAAIRQIRGGVDYILVEPRVGKWNLLKCPLPCKKMIMRNLWRLMKQQMRQPTVDLAEGGNRTALRGEGWVAESIRVVAPGEFTGLADKLGRGWICHIGKPDLKPIM
jgi:hypothetical protein